MDRCAECTKLREDCYSKLERYTRVLQQQILYYRAGQSELAKEFARDVVPAASDAYSEAQAALKDHDKTQHGT